MFHVEAEVAAVHHVVRTQVRSDEVDGGDAGGGTLHPRIEATWESLTTGARKRVLTAMVEHLAATYGFSYSIDWHRLSDDTWDDEVHPGITWGMWDDNGNDWNPFDAGRMHLNPNALDDPLEMIDTVAHEARHAQQNQAAADVDAWRWPWSKDPFARDAAHGITKRQARRWKANFEDYKAYDQDNSSTGAFEAYHGQPVEVDARRAATRYVNGLSDKEFERLLRKSR